MSGAKISKADKIEIADRALKFTAEVIADFVREYPVGQFRRLKRTDVQDVLATVSNEIMARFVLS